MYLLPGNQLQAGMMPHWNERSLRLTSGSRVSKCTQRERGYAVSDPPISVSAPHAPILRMRPGETAALLAGVLTRSVGEAEACSARTLLLA
jgi:hypothetical protein